MTSAPILEVSQLSKTFTTNTGVQTVALQATDLTVAENDFITILGPSGCGKSTLLRMVAGLDTPTSGTIVLDGQPITGPGADRGMVFQSYTLFPWLTVLQNVCFGLREKGRPLSAQHEVAHQFIKKSRANGFRKPLSQAAFRWHAAAHGAGPRSG